MTGVLVHWLLRPLHWNLTSPSSCERLRIVDSEFVEKCARIGACETFNEMHALARTSEVRSGSEIRRIDDQRVSISMTPRVAHPLPNVLRKMWLAVHRNNTSIVDLLVKNDDVAGRLNQLKIIVVAGRCHWRATVRSHDTTLGKRPVLRSFCEALIGFVQGGHSFLRLWCQGRNPSIRRIDNQRSTSARHELCPTVPPKFVVGGGEVFGLDS